MDKILNPCPFCGSENVMGTRSITFHFVICANCKSVGPDANSSREAITKWNDRFKTVGEEMMNAKTKEVQHG